MAENFLDGTGAKPVSWWMFDDASSPSADGNTSTGNDLGWFNGSPAQDTSVKVEGTASLSVPTSSDEALRTFANVNASTPMKGATTDFTIGGWMYLKGNATSGNGFHFNDGSGGIRISTLTSGKLRLVLPGTAIDIQNDSAIAADGWHHVVARWQGSTDDEICLILDGVKQASATTVASVVLATSANLGFLGNAGGVIRFDEWFMFSTALTDAQVLDIYQHGLSGTLNMTTASPGVGAVTVTGLKPQPQLTPPTLTASEPQYAAVSAGSLGDNTLVEGVANKRIRVVAMALVASGGTNTVTLQSGASGIALTGGMDLADNAQWILPYNAAGWCETGTGDLLNLSLGAAHGVAGVVDYVLVEI